MDGEALNPTQPSILMLDDYSILEILKKLQPYEFFNMMETCTRIAVLGRSLIKREIEKLPIVNSCADKVVKEYSWIQFKSEKERFLTGMEWFQGTGIPHSTLMQYPSYLSDFNIDKEYIYMAKRYTILKYARNTNYMLSDITPITVYDTNLNLLSGFKKALHADKYLLLQQNGNILVLENGKVTVKTKMPSGRPVYCDFINDIYAWANSSRMQICKEVTEPNGDINLSTIKQYQQTTTSLFINNTATNLYCAILNREGLSKLGGIDLEKPSHMTFYGPNTGFSHVFTALKEINENIILGANGIITMFDKRMHEIAQTYQLQTCVRCVDYDGNNVLSCGTLNNSVHMLDIRKGRFFNVFTQQGYRGLPVLNVKLDNAHLFTFNVQTFCIHALHKTSIRPHNNIHFLKD